jgi:hypothetical protein
LYGLSSGSSSRVDLGAAASPSGWQNALTQGYATSQGAQDLEKAATGGLGAVQSVQNEFGTGSSIGSGTGSAVGSSGMDGMTQFMDEILGLMKDIIQQEFPGGF